MTRFLPLAVVCAWPAVGLAGLHYSGEGFRDLPADWRGYLPDHRALRAVAAPGLAGGRPTPLRDEYADAALRLEAAARARPLTADEAADLGALLVRLGHPAKAVDVLRPAARRDPAHFRLAANLGTAWQLLGDLDQAAAALEDAVRLAPPRWREAEAAHLRLVHLRLREGKPAKDPPAPDALFGPGPPPADALGVAQQLAVWLPADGRLLWLLGELAHAGGDVRTAAAVLDGCVTEFGMGAAELRARRQRYRAAADDLDAKGEPRPAGRFKSSRALVRGLDPARLPASNPTGVSVLPWAAVGETEFGPNGKPTFLPYLGRLDGRRVTLTGFMAPAGGGRGGEVAAFLLTENPVGCWFCEAPGPGQMVAVDLADGATADPTRAAVTVTGTLRLNRTDPERFPLLIAGAAVGQPD